MDTLDAPQTHRPNRCIGRISSLLSSFPSEESYISRLSCTHMHSSMSPPCLQPLEKRQLSCWTLDVEEMKVFTGGLCLSQTSESLLFRLHWLQKEVVEARQHVQQGLRKVRQTARFIEDHPGISATVCFWLQVFIVTQMVAMMPRVIMVLLNISLTKCKKSHVNSGKSCSTQHVCSAARGREALDEETPHKTVKFKRQNNLDPEGASSSRLSHV